MLSRNGRQIKIRDTFIKSVFPILNSFECAKLNVLIKCLKEHTKFHTKVSKGIKKEDFYAEFFKSVEKVV
jgi:hypothetical protein